MAKRSKPKFKVGQVVRYKFDGTFVQISSLPDAEGNYYMRGHYKDSWGWEKEFRALTAREKGPAK